jgi:hypothetical protein
MNFYIKISSLVPGPDRAGDQGQVEVSLIHYLKELKRFYAELLNITKSLILLIPYLERNYPYSKNRTP